MATPNDLTPLIASHHPLLAARIDDETRFFSLLREAATSAGVQVWTWSLTRGLAREGMEHQGGTTDLKHALSFIQQLSQPAVFVLLDVEPSPQDPAMAPVVLWIDEIEKGFATGEHVGDSGVSLRVLGSFLRWLQDRGHGVFLVAPCNDINKLPPELLRRGRFDEMFFVDLPTAEERRDVVELHLQRRRRDPGSFDLTAVVAATEGFSGAEIEGVVVARDVPRLCPRGTVVRRRSPGRSRGDHPTLPLASRGHHAHACVVPRPRGAGRATGRVTALTQPSLEACRRSRYKHIAREGFRPVRRWIAR